MIPLQNILHITVFETYITGKRIENAFHYSIYYIMFLHNYYNNYY